MSKQSSSIRRPTYVAGAERLLPPAMSAATVGLLVMDLASSANGPAPAIARTLQMRMPWRSRLHSFFTVVLRNGEFFEAGDAHGRQGTPRVAASDAAHACLV
jgi:hypothetical protein